MASEFTRHVWLASTALSLSLAPFAANAGGIPLPVGSDLDFTDTTGTPKGSFTSVAPAGWTGGGNLVFVDSTTIPGAQAASPTYLTTYGNPVGTVTGNYIEADGNPTYEDSFSRQLTKLTIGQQYTLSFYQGASQQTTFSGATTNQWIVSLGADPLAISYSGASCVPGDGSGNCTASYSDADPGASVKASPLMSVPSEGTVGWNFVSVTLTADATSELLSFLAWGNGGNTVNEPPMAFLAGIDQPAGEGIPEPVSMSLFGVGLAGLGVVARRRRQKIST